MVSTMPLKSGVLVLDNNKANWFESGGDKEKHQQRDGHTFSNGTFIADAVAKKCHQPLPPPQH